MIQISKEQFDKLAKAKLLDYSKANKNFTVVNRNKKSKRKKYYVTALRSILSFLDIKE